MLSLKISVFGHMSLPWNICLLLEKSVDFLSTLILVLSSSWNALLAPLPALCLLKSYLSSKTPLKCLLQEAYHLHNKHSHLIRTAVGILMFCLASPRMGREKCIQKGCSKVSVGIGVGLEEI